jgi:hypothetical protein
MLLASDADLVPLRHGYKKTIDLMRGRSRYFKKYTKMVTIQPAGNAKLTSTTSQDAIDSRPSCLRSEGGDGTGPDTNRAIGSPLSSRSSAKATDSHLSSGTTATDSPLSSGTKATDSPLSSRSSAKATDSPECRCARCQEPRCHVAMGIWDLGVGVGVDLSRGVAGGS